MLEKERNYYAAHANEWNARNPGSFVVVKDEALVGVFTAIDDALAAGASQFGLEPFLVRQLGVEPRPVSIPALTLGLLHADS